MTSRESHWERDNHVRIKRMKFDQVHVSINHIKFRELWNFPFSESRIFSKFRKILTLIENIGNWQRKFYWLFFRKFREFLFFDILIILLNSRLFLFDRFVWIRFYEFSWIKTAWHESGLSKSGIINRPTYQKFNSLTTIKMQFEKCQKRQFLVSKSQKLASHR